MKQPLVSVVMSVWNEEKYLTASIESILNQTFTDYEFVIINDGSTDRTQEILEIFVHKDTRIKLILNAMNVGCAASLNKGIEIARGKYIARMDSGDISNPTRFEKQVNYLEGEKNVSALGTCGYWIDEHKQVIATWNVVPTINSTILYKGAPTIDPSLMITKELFNTIGFYKTKYNAYDFEFLARALKNHITIANLQDYLFSTMRRRGGLQYRSIRRERAGVLRTKFSYLPYFLSCKSMFYTLKSLVGCCLPTSVMEKLADRWIMQSAVSTKTPTANDIT